MYRNCASPRQQPYAYAQQASNFTSARSTYISQQKQQAGVLERLPLFKRQASFSDDLRSSQTRPLHDCSDSDSSGLAALMQISGLTQPPPNRSYLSRPETNTHDAAAAAAAAHVRHHVRHADKNVQLESYKCAPSIVDVVA